MKIIFFILCMMFMFPVYANMGVGDSGEEVLLIQKKLASEGFFIKDLDGKFGQQTENAVKSYQYENNLPMTGEVDKDLYMKLLNTQLPSRFSMNVSMIRKVVATAMGLQGIPYVFGGTTPYGFDCSGFVQYVMRQAGIEIPRMADEQYYASTKREHPKVGDLVFFSTYLPGVSHVGIYLGNDEFIHASSSKGITVSSLKDTYWFNSYVGAGRVL